MWRYTTLVKHICFSLAFNITIYCIIKQWIKLTGGHRDSYHPDSHHRNFCELDRYVIDVLYPN